jgi:hypothetical protein
MKQNKAFTTQNHTDIIPTENISLMGMHNGNFCYLSQENDKIYIRCEFEAGHIKKLSWPINGVLPHSILEKFKFNWRKATWIKTV